MASVSVCGASFEARTKVRAPQDDGA